MHVKISLCVGYHCCGIKELHRKHTQKLNNLKKEVKDLEKKISRGKESLRTVSDFKSKSETFFFRNDAMLEKNIHSAL